MPLGWKDEGSGKVKGRVDPDEPIMASVLVRRLLNYRYTPSLCPAPIQAACPMISVISQCLMVSLYTILQAASIFVVVILQLHGRYNDASTLLFTAGLHLLLSVSGIVLTWGLFTPTCVSPTTALRRVKDLPFGNPRSSRRMRMLWSCCLYAFPSFLAVFLIGAPASSLRRFVASLDPMCSSSKLLRIETLAILSFLLSTGAFYSATFKQRQWVGLCLLGVSVFLYWVSSNEFASAATSSGNRVSAGKAATCSSYGSSSTSLHTVLTLVFQGFLSAIAGVLTEYAFKRDASLSVHVQNSIVYLFALLFAFWNCSGEHHVCYYKILWNPTYFPLQLVAALAGPVGGCVLRYTNSIVKVFADVVALWVASVIIQWYVFRADLSVVLIGGIGLLLIPFSFYLVCLRGSSASSLLGQSRHRDPSLSL